MKCNLCKKTISFIVEKFIPIILPAICFIIYLSINILCKIPIMYKIKILSDDFLNMIFTEDKMSIISTISVVSIGLYVTVMSVFGSSQSSAVSELSKNNLANRFVRYACVSLISVFINLITTVFYDTTFVEFYTIIFIWMLANLIRFTFIVLMMYNHNIKYSESELEKSKAKEQEIIKLLTQINNKLEYESEGNKAYFNKIKESNDLNRKIK